MSASDVRTGHRMHHRERSEAIADAIARTCPKAAQAYMDAAWLREVIDFEANYPALARQNQDS